MKHRRERGREVHVDGKHVTFGQSHRRCQWVTYWESGVIWLLILFLWNNGGVLSALIIPFMYKFSDFMRMSYPNFVLFRKALLCGFLSSRMHPFTYLYPRMALATAFRLNTPKKFKPSYPAARVVQEVVRWQMGTARCGKSIETAKGLMTVYCGLQTTISVCFFHHSYSYQALDKI